MNKQTVTATEKPWCEQMSEAYAVGLADGKAGERRGRPNEFEACYEQGWQHGKRQHTETVLQTWDQARANMRECLRP